MRVRSLIYSLLTTAALLLAGGSPPICQAAAPAGAPSDHLQWWQDAKFGMFIHWGIYSQAGGEWNGETDHAEWLQFTAKIPIREYTEYAKKFNPLEFDADQWVSLAKRAGMKYLVITSKHHDGFAMFDSPSNDYNIIKGTVFGRDPIKELAEACQKQGLKFCVYYSLGRDWHDPDVPTGRGKRKAWRSNLVDYPDEDRKDFSKYFERKVKPQVRELLTQYGPIGVMWFDTPELITRKQSVELKKLIHQLQPDCIINARIGNELGDYTTPEQQIPDTVDRRPWETCMTLNGKWGYNKADQNWKSSELLIRNLIDITSKGGNYLLNVGPTGEGVIPAPSVERLRAVGDWLAINAEAIYDCGPTPFGDELGKYVGSKPNNGRKKQPFKASWRWRATTKPGKLYIHVLDWPGPELKLPAIKSKATKAYLLADKSHASLPFTQTDNSFLISLPAEPLDSVATVICIDTTDAD